MWTMLAACNFGLPKEIPPGIADPSCAVPIEFERTFATVEAIARSPRSTAARRREVRDWLQAELVAAGFAPEELPFTISGVQGVNLVARGAAPARVLVGAHYDTVSGSPGADDNASGVAVVLELARVLGPTAPVTWVWFDAEEPHDAAVGTDGRNFAYGSQAFVDREPSWDVGFVVESVGYRCDGCQQVPTGVPKKYADGNAIYWVGNPSDRWADLAATFDAGSAGARSRLFTVSARGKVVPQSRFSDHAPLWDVGVDAVLVTDTALLRNPHYHEDTDQPATLDPTFLADVTRGLAAAVRSATGGCSAAVPGG